jgi:hypothetical protein
MLETPKALDTMIFNIISENSNGCNNGQSAGNQKNNILQFIFTNKLNK